MSAVKGLCVAPLPVLSCVASCVTHRRPEEPAGAGEGAGVRASPGPRCWLPARSGPLSPVTVSSLSLTVCSQLDVFCGSVKGFGRQTHHSAVWVVLSVCMKRWHPGHNGNVSPLQKPLPPRSLFSHFGFFNAIT